MRQLAGGKHNRTSFRGLEYFRKRNERAVRKFPPRAAKFIYTRPVCQPLAALFRVFAVFIKATLSLSLSTARAALSFSPMLYVCPSGNVDTLIVVGSFHTGLILDNSVTRAEPKARGVKEIEELFCEMFARVLTVRIFDAVMHCRILAFNGARWEVSKGKCYYRELRANRYI